MDMIISLERANRDRRVAASYVAFLGLCCVVYVWLWLRGFAEFDHYLTLSAGLQTLAFLLLGAKVQAWDTEGISPNMLIAYILSYVTRLSTTFVFQGYLPEDDTSGVYLYQLSELGGLVVLVWNLYTFMKMRAANMMQLGEWKEHPLVVPVMVILSLVLGALTKSSGHGNYLGDLCWMFSQWMDTFAIAPQLWRVSRQTVVERRTSHFIFLMISSRLVLAFFWAMILWAQPVHWSFAVGLGLSNLIHIVLCADYLYYFVRSIRQGSMVLPGMPL